MKKLLSRPAPLLQKWLLSLLLCLPFLVAAIVSAFSGDRTFQILSLLLFLFCSIHCAELYLTLKDNRYHVEEGICLSVSVIPFQQQKKVTLQRPDGRRLIFRVEKRIRLSVGMTYRVYLPSKDLPSGTEATDLLYPSALAIEKVEQYAPEQC